MEWLNPGRWLAVLLLCVTLYLLHLSDKAKALDGVRAEYAKAALKQSEENRLKEKALILSVERLRADYAKQKAINANLARANADRLREFQAAASSAGGDSESSSRTHGPFAAIAGECARAIAEMDDHAQGLRATASALQEFAATVRVKKD